MPLIQLEHYLVLTDDLDGTRDFYAKALGMRIGPRPPLGFPGYWLYLGEVPCIHIAEWESYRTYSIGAGIGISTRAPGTGPVDHIAFNGTNVESIQSALIAQGATTFDPLNSSRTILSLISRLRNFVLQLHRALLARSEIHCMALYDTYEV